MLGVGASVHAVSHLPAIMGTLMWCVNCWASPGAEPFPSRPDWGRERWRCNQPRMPPGPAPAPDKGGKPCCCCGQVHDGNAGMQRGLGCGSGCGCGGDGCRSGWMWQEGGECGVPCEVMQHSGRDESKLRRLKSILVCDLMLHCKACAGCVGSPRAVRRVGC